MAESIKEPVGRHPMGEDIDGNSGVKMPYKIVGTTREEFLEDCEGILEMLAAES